MEIAFVLGLLLAAVVLFARETLPVDIVTLLVLLAPVTSIARRRKWSPSRLLMPLAFASILGGTCTLIGTSTNVAVSGFIERAGMPPIGFFELSPVGLLIVIAGTIYLALIGRRLLPVNAA